MSNFKGGAFPKAWSSPELRTCRAAGEFFIVRVMGPPDSHPESNPPPLPTRPDPPAQGDATGGVIPYKNPHALTAYYLGIFSLIPGLGFFLGIAAFVLGLLGLRTKKRHPEVRGTVHAWIGIIIGAVVVLLHLVLIGLMIVPA